MLSKLSDQTCAEVVLQAGFFGGATEDGVSIDITDTGTGIPLDVDAFEPFVTTKKEGTGIGLVIVRQIVAAHGGNISYRSRPGEGTTFHLELPRN
jgi:signal transduction histidine kinase